LDARAFYSAFLKLAVGRLLKMQTSEELNAVEKTPPKDDSPFTFCERNL
jgi:hypothetical protein